MSRTILPSGGKTARRFRLKVGLRTFLQQRRAMKVFTFILLLFLASLIGSGAGQGSDKSGKADEGTYLEECPGERCEVHGNSLYRGVAPIEYGLFKAADEKTATLEEAAERLFPHAKVKVICGCVEKKATQARVCFCPWCRISRERWLKEPTGVKVEFPIEVAYGKIQTGMKEEDLFALMAPYKNLYTKHHQWQRWAEGHTVVYVTIWPEGGLLAREPAAWGPSQVEKKSMKKEVFDEGQNRWVPVWTPPDDRIVLPPKKRPIKEAAK